jgi:hypothetical protein
VIERIYAPEESNIIPQCNADDCRMNIGHCVLNACCTYSLSCYLL